MQNADSGKDCRSQILAIIRAQGALRRDREGRPLISELPIMDGTACVARDQAVPVKVVGMMGSATSSEIALVATVSISMLPILRAMRFDVLSGPTRKATSMPS